MTQPLPQIDHSTRPAQPSRLAFWGGWVLSGLPSLFMGGLGLVMLLTNREMVRDSMAQQGFTDPTRATIIILSLEIVSVLIYLIPRTAVLGATLLTGYLGGAIATHLRIGEYPQMIPAIVLGIMIWLGLFLREPRLRVLTPFRRPAAG